MAWLSTKGNEANSSWFIGGDDHSLVKLIDFDDVPFSNRSSQLTKAMRSARIADGGPFGGVKKPFYTWEYVGPNT